MARPKKTTTKKTTSTRPRVAGIGSKRNKPTAAKPHQRGVARASSAKPHQSKATKATPKKARTSAKSDAKSPSGDAIIKMLKSTPSTKRPPNNPDIPQNIITMLNQDLNAIKELLDNYAKHLRSLDRRRLNGVGIKKLGFIRRTERGRDRACTGMTERVRIRRA